MVWYYGNISTYSHFKILGDVYYRKFIRTIQFFLQWFARYTTTKFKLAIE